MKLVSSLLLAAAGLLASPACSPALAELAGFPPGLNGRGAALLAAEEDRAALRELRAEVSSMPPSEQAGEAELIVQSGPRPADLAAALNVLAADIDDPEKTVEDAAVDTLNALGAEVDGSFFDFDDFIGCVGYYYDGPPDLGSFTAACVCLAQGTGAREFGFRAAFCGIAGPLVDAVQSEIDTDLGTGVLVGVAQVLALIDPLIPAPPPTCSIGDPCTCDDPSENGDFACSSSACTPDPCYSGIEPICVGSKAPDVAGPPGPAPPRTCDVNAHRRYLSSPVEGAKRYLLHLDDEWNIQQYMDTHPVSVDRAGTFYEKPDILDAEECETLMEYLEAGGKPSDQDELSEYFQIHDRILTAEELVSLLGREKAGELFRFLHDSVGDRGAIVRKIWLRRVTNDGSTGNYVDLHTDHDHAKYKQSTMVVALNAEEDIRGGEIFYLSQNGTAMPGRAQGKAHAHRYDVFHGVAHHSGTRVSLLVHLDHEPAPGIEDLASNVLDVSGVRASLGA